MCERDANCRENNQFYYWVVVGYNYGDLVRYNSTNCLFSSRLLQLFLGILFFVFAFSHRPPLISGKGFGLCFMAPTLLSLIPGLPARILAWAPRGCALFLIFYMMLCLISRFRQIVSSTIDDIRWAYNIVRHYGLYTLLENQWLRLQMPQVYKSEL